MSISDKIKENQIIFISGTPCTGKTTIATKLNDFLTNNGFNSYFIKINDFAIENDLVLGKDPDKLYAVIDIGRLDEVLNKEINNFLDENSSDDSKTVVVEGHLSHLCNGADKTIILRLNPEKLLKRLEERKYSENKIHENLEAEALAVCSAEAYDLYGDKASEIDTTNKSVDETLDTVLKIIYGELESPVGSVDFMDWFLL